MAKSGFWKRKRVMVVGGAGFIGSHTVDALVEQGASVSVVDDLSVGKREYVNRRARLYRMDMASSRLAGVFRKEKPECVILLAAISSVPETARNPVADARNIAGMVNVLQRCVSSRVKRILYSSSGFIYGNAKSVPTPEREPFQPLTPYNISKAAGESYLKFFKSFYGLPYVILRYGTVYGPRQVNRVIADYIMHISRNRRAEIYGTKTRDYIFVSDVVRANLAALRRAHYRGEPVFNISGGRETNLVELYRMIAAFLGRPENTPLHLPPRKGEVDRFCLDIRRAKRVLKFRPTVPLARGLAETAEWFLKKGKR